MPIIIARLRSLLRRYQPDVLHAHSAGGYAWSAWACFYSPYIVTPWGTDLVVDAQCSKINKWLTSLALRQAALVTTDGFHFVGILRRLGVAEKSIFLHTFGTDVTFFCPGEDRSERFALGVGDAPLIISTRTLNPVHEVEVFVRAIPIIHATVPSARFIIVGDGTDRLRLEGLAGELGVASLISFTGMVNEDRMLRLLRVSDIYVSTSRIDAGLAASTAEAMAVGLPVIQTDNSDNAYWTPHDEGGYLIQNGGYSALAEAAIRLLQASNKRHEMGNRNRKLVIAKYNMDTEMSRIENQYRRVCGKLEL